jgi:hypothetical protein
LKIPALVVSLAIGAALGSARKSWTDPYIGLRLQQPLAERGPSSRTATSAALASVRCLEAASRLQNRAVR